MKKILLASGCSFTDKNFTSDFHPEMDTKWPMWPELLAKKLNMNCINLGQSGSGNEYIYSTLLDEIAKRGDNIGLVVAAWSQCQRKDWRSQMKSHPYLHIWHNNADFCNKVIGRIGDNDMYAYVNKSLRYYYSLQEVCKSKKIPLKHFQMLHLFRGYTYDPITGLKKEKTEKRKELLEAVHKSPYFNLMDDDFIGWPTDTSLGGFNIKQEVLGGYESKKYDVSKQDSHPNAKGQEKIAEFLYERL